MNAIARFEARARQIDSLLVVGLDPDFERLPPSIRQFADCQFRFNRRIIEQTHMHAAAYKLNTAFYEARGAAGWADLERTIGLLRANYPDILTIADAKRGDIGNTSAAYATAFFDTLGFDAITVQPYLGGDALRPFLERPDHAAIVLCHTSNPGAGEFQALPAPVRPLWQVIAQQAITQWSDHDNVMLVIGATAPDEIAEARQAFPATTFLLPGIGAQGGNLVQAIRAGVRPDGLGLMISASRSIHFSDSPAVAAHELRQAINLARHAE
jgi:orotidine-5'-phosphate decarboxylase